MPTRLLLGCAIAAVVVGALAFGSGSAAASQTSTSRPVAPPAMPQRQLESPVEREMQALERHARVNMILYSGRLGDMVIATPVVALRVPAR